MKNDIAQRARILQTYEGWEIHINGRTFRYTHNDEDYGVTQLAKMLQMLGFAVAIEEDC
jgi:hypothetical protein